MIAGAVGARYRVRAVDLGSVLRVRLLLTNSEGAAEERSKPTAPVTTGPVLTPPPTPTPTPTPPSPPAPTPTATPTPGPTPVPEPTPAPEAPPAPVRFDSVASPPATTAPGRPAAPSPTPTASPAPRAPRPLRPFPIVRIKGALTVTGARVTLLSVSAPRGARVTVLCRGDDCPRRRFAAPTGARRLRLFERELRAGTRLELRVTRAGHIGKYTAIVIRRGAAPWRSDRCLQPGKTRPVECASG